MKNFRFLFLLLAFVFLGANQVFSQVLLGLPYQKGNMPKPVANQHIREADVMYSKIVYRRIQLSEKANQHLYFPTTEQEGRKSLIDVLLDAIQTQGLTAYDENGSGNEFATILTEKEIEERMGTHTTILYLPNDSIEDGPLTPTPLVEKYVSSDVKSYLIKEICFFDKQGSILGTATIGICPIRFYYREEDKEHLEPKQKKVFWVYYPEVREILSKAECYNPQNDASRMSFDAVFQKHYYTSYIEQESNMYDNRSIAEYLSGEDVLIESKNIQEKNFNREQDLWEN